MSRFIIRICLTFLFCFLFGSRGGNAQLLSPEMGTIIVTYQTDQDGQRLDRIRFWLMNENQERTLYPKKDEFVANSHSRIDRTVVITHLPVGKYRIEFLIPNADQFFEEVAPREVELSAGAVAKIDQSIRKRLVEDHLESAETLKEIKDSSVSQNDALLPVIIVNRPPPGPLPFPSGPVPLRPARLTLHSNIITPWRLMHDGQLIHSGNGPVNNLPLPPGRNYYLLSKDLPGYSLHMIPPNPFDVEPGSTINIELVYQHDVGYVELKGQLPSSEKLLTIRILHEQHQQPPLEVKIKPINGQIAWQSGALATGEYLIIFELSGDSKPPEKLHFFVGKGRRTDLVYPTGARETKEISQGEKGSLEVTTDISQAIYNLSDQNGTSIGQGQGFSYLFSNLAPGKYELKFSSADPRIFIPPPTQEVVISDKKKTQVLVTYNKMGLLTIGSNADSYSVMIQSEDKPDETIKERVVGRSKNIYLPEGRYTIIYEPLAPGASSPKSAIATVRSTSPQTVYQAYELVSGTKSTKVVPQEPEEDEDEDEDEEGVRSQEQQVKR